MLRFNNKLVRVNGNLSGEVIITPEPPEPFVQYNYTTFKARTSGTLYWDPIGGTFKYFNNSTSKDLTTGCFSGCTTAPDYNYCLTTYPGWF